MIAEDDLFGSRIHKFYPERMINNKIHLFYNGKETLEFQKSQECTQKKYLILPDLNMPVMNGEKIPEVLQSKNYKTQTDVFIVTSSTSARDNERAPINEIGHNYFVTSE